MDNLLSKEELEFAQHMREFYRTATRSARN